VSPQVLSAQLQGHSWQKGAVMMLGVGAAAEVSQVVGPCGYHTQHSTA
jgi:hypothetical protein